MPAATSSAVFAPVAAPSTREETIARLGVAIRIGVLAPGERLPGERELARQLGISRSTLREALSVLSGSGHLTAVRGRSGGTFVAGRPPVASVEPFAPERSRGLLDWRRAIELGAVALATERATDAERESLDAAAGLLEDEAVLQDWAAFRRADVAFHLRLAEAARSPRLVMAMTRVHGELSDLLHGLAPPPAPRPACLKDHCEVARAVRSGDAMAASEAMRQHLIATELAVDDAQSATIASISTFAPRGSALTP